MDPASVVEFLLLSPDFPRAVLYCLRSAEVQLAVLGEGVSGLGRSRRMLGRLRASVEYRNVDELVEEGLTSFLTDLQDGVRDVAVAVATEFFRHGQPSTLHTVATRLMRLDISYVTRFTYEHEVAESQNELRAAPTVDDRQQVVHYDVRTTPSSRVFSYTDYWGTRVDAFGSAPRTASSTVVADATVETSPPAVLAASPRFADLTPAFLDEHLEYLERSPHVDWSDGIAAEVAGRRDGADDDVVGFVLALHRLVGTSCTYAPGATYVGVPIDDVLGGARGRLPGLRPPADRDVPCQWHPGPVRVRLPVRGRRQHRRGGPG